MLLVYGAGPGVVDYFLDGRHPGRWSAGATALLGLEGPVERGDLHAVLRGVEPRTGELLHRSGTRRRRAGWDLIFCAPKSVSLLRATSARDGGAVSEAHQAAVHDVLDHLERHLHSRSMRPADGLISAEFVHTSNQAGEPHLHSHVIAANLSRSDGVWKAVDPEPWRLGRVALSGLYQLSLRHHLAALEIGLDWRLRPDGLADLASVPRAAVRAASSQSSAVARFGRFEARRQAGEAEWQGRVAAAGMGPTTAVPTTAVPTTAVPAATVRAAGVSVPGRSEAPRLSASDDRLARAVATRLASRRSDFRQEDVIAALAACHPGGATTAESLSWTDRFCQDAEPVRSPTSRPRWTTSLARSADLELTRRLQALRPCQPIERQVARDAMDGAYALTADQHRAVEQLLCDDRPVVRLHNEPGNSGLLDRAEIIDACRAVCSAAGLTVAVSTPTPAAASRWEILSGISRHTPKDGASLIVVDRADRRPSADLIALAAEAEQRSARLVLIEGGTLPRLTAPASLGLYAVTGSESIACPEAPVWDLGSTSRSTNRDGDPVLRGRDVAAKVLEAWAESPGTSMVGLGLDEVDGLNRAASRLSRDRPPSAPGRVPGDRVVVIKGSRDLPYATLGTVTSVEPRTATFEVSWDGGSRTSRLPTGTAAVRAGWALSAQMAARLEVPALVLGRERDLTFVLHRKVQFMAPDPPGPGRHRGLGR